MIIFLNCLDRGANISTRCKNISTRCKNKAARQPNDATSPPYRLFTSRLDSSRRQLHKMCCFSINPTSIAFTNLCALGSPGNYYKHTGFAVSINSSKSLKLKSQKPKRTSIAFTYLCALDSSGNYYKHTDFAISINSSKSLKLISQKPKRLILNKI